MEDKIHNELYGASYENKKFYFEIAFTCIVLALGLLFAPKKRQMICTKYQPSVTNIIFETDTSFQEKAFQNNESRLALFGAN